MRRKNTPKSKTRPLGNFSLWEKFSAQEFSGWVRERITRGAPARHQLINEPRRAGNPRQVPLASFLSGGGSLPLRAFFSRDRPRSPLVAHGIAARFPAATLSEEIETHFDVEDLAISFAAICVGVVIRGAFSTDFIYFCWRPRLSKRRPAHLAECSVVDGDRDSAGWVSWAARWASPFSRMGSSFPQ